jgi:hypothetical protein
LVKVSEDVCAWVGKLGNLEEHVEDEHGDILCRDYVFGCNSLTNNALILLLNQEIFLYYKYISHSGVMFVIVQQVGVTNRKYGYTVEILASNEKDDDIYRNFTAYKITDPFDPIFDNHRCMVIRVDSLDPYVQDGEILMCVGINEFGPSVQTDIEKCEPDGYNFDAKKAERVPNLDINTMCPLKKIPEKSCPWIGPFGCLEKHVNNTHWDDLRTCFAFFCNSLENKAFLISLQKEIFLYYKYYSDTGNMYAVVQQVGLTNKKFKFTIQIVSFEKGAGTIEFTSAVGSISEPFQTVFNAKRCLVVSIEKLEPYILADGLNMFVAITKFSS